MTLWQLILKETAHRKLGFALGLLSVTIATACLVGALTLLRAHDLRTRQIVARKEMETRAEMARMEDDYRKIMKKLGYNVLILHKDQDLDELQTKGYATHYLPDDYAQRLAKGKIATLNHLLPVLQQRLVWPENGHEITLAGIRGQVPTGNAASDAKAPIMQPVPPDGMDMGFTLAHSLKLAVRRQVRLLGRDFTVAKIFPRRGNQDDTTVWIPLDAAQALLQRPGQINGILALECTCEPDALGAITKDVTRILPDTQVFEFSSLARARAEARTRAAKTGKQAIAAEIANREALRREREQLAAVLVPLVIAGCIFWIASLIFINVRERRSEVGILRAIGVHPRQILLVFVGKALLMGLGGALAGYLVGFIVGAAWGGAPSPQLFTPWLLLGVLLLAPILAGVAGWLPAMLAAEQDPAMVLRED